MKLQKITMLPAVLLFAICTALVDPILPHTNSEAQAEVPPEVRQCIEDCASIYNNLLRACIKAAEDSDHVLGLGGSVAILCFIEANLAYNACVESCYA